MSSLCADAHLLPIEREREKERGSTVCEHYTSRYVSATDVGCLGMTSKVGDVCVTAL